MRGRRITSLMKRGFTRPAEAMGSSPLGAFDEIRLLASRLRGVAAQRRGRKHACDLALREEARAAKRTDWLRPDADRGIEFERHQGRGGAVARCLVDGGCTGCGYGTA